MPVNTKKTVITNIALLAAVIIVALFFHGRSYIFSVANFILIYIISTAGLDLLFGYSGQISLGHAGFYCIGAYTTALLSINTGIHPLITMLIGAIFAAIVGIILAFPAAKLKYHFLSLVTIAFGEMVYLLSVTSPGDITNGFSGVYGIPVINLFGISFKSNYNYFFLLLFFVVIFLFVKWRIVHSKIGRAFVAIRDNTTAANGMGINVRYYRVMAFAISAFYTAFAGGLYAHMIRFISPEVFTQDNISIPMITMVLFGGFGTQWGPVIGAIVVTIINELLQAAGTYRMIIYGCFVVIVLLFMPRGIMSFVNDVSGKIGRRAAAAKEGEHA